MIGMMQCDVEMGGKHNDFGWFYYCFLLLEGEFCPTIGPLGADNMDVEAFFVGSSVLTAIPTYESV